MAKTCLFILYYRKLADVLKRKRTSKKTSNSSLTGSSSTSRKTRNEIESLVSHPIKSCVSTTPNLSSSHSLVDYEPVTANMGSQILSSNYVSMPFFAYSAPTTTSTTGSPSNTSNNSLNNNSAPNICSAAATGALMLNPSAPISMPVSNNNNQVLISGSASNRGRSSKLSSAAAKTSSFFANLYPARWKRWNNANPSIIGSNPSNLSAQKSMLLSQSQDHLGSLSSSSPRSPNKNCNKEKIRIWIKEQAKAFLEKYFDNSDNTDEAMSTLNRINAAMDIFAKGKDLQALRELKSVLMEGDISPFELIHCGIIKKLMHYLTHTETGDNDRDARIRRFFHVFLGTPADANTVISFDPTIKLNPTPFSSLVNKLNACISQLEQFPVRVHDIIGTGAGNIRGTSALKFFNTHQLKCNLQRHRDCSNLKQWRGGPVRIDPLALVQAIERYLLLRGFGKVREDDDENSDEDNSDEDFEDNMASVMVNQGQGKHKLQFMIDGHILPYNMTVYQAIRQFSSSLNHHSGDGHETDGDFDAPIGHANMWVQTHSIHYRQYVETNSPTTFSSCNGTGLHPSSSLANNLSPGNTHLSSVSCNNIIAGHSFNTSSSSSSSCMSSGGRRSSKSTSSKSSTSKKKDELWLEGKSPQLTSTIYSILNSPLPSSVTISDASLEVITLLRIVNELNRSWGWFYNLSYVHYPAIPQSEFVNSKLTAKANRQLQDPLVIMTGNIPSWLSQIAYVCPFLFPFETRHLLFYVTSFDRDRALQRLLDSTPGLNSNDSTERVTPRLDKRKKTVTRDDILRQAENVFHDVGNSKALLEIQYDNEVGTGLGPTLEFYALVSKELQRADLEMWRGDVVSASPVVVPQSRDKLSTAPSGSSDMPVNKENDKSRACAQIQYVYSPEGLFPAPLGRSAKSTSVSKVKSKYKLLGKFLAKALCDSRMVCLLNLYLQHEAHLF